MLTATSKISVEASPEMELKEQKAVKKKHLGSQEKLNELCHKPSSEQKLKPLKLIIKGCVFS